MATLEIGDEAVTVRLGRFEHVLAFSRDVVLPLSAILKVSATSSTWLALRGWRAAGTVFPGRIALGARRHGSGWDFTAIERSRPAVLIELSAGRYEQVLVSVDDPEETAARVARAAGIAYP